MSPIKYENGEREILTEPVCCPLDSGTAALLFEKDGHFHYRCDTCGLQFIWPRPDQETLLALFGDRWFQLFEDTKGDRQVRARGHREDLLRDLLDVSQTHDRTLLDVGCGMGDFLEAVRGDFRLVRGLEICKPMRTFAQERLGLDVLEGEAEAIPLADESEDVIILWHVLEYLLDPRASLRELRRVLAARGRLVISTWNPESITARLLGKRWAMYDPTSHLNLFPPRSLVRLLESKGFEVLTLRTYYLLLFHVLQVWRGRRPGDQAVIRSRQSARLQQAIEQNRLLKAAMVATNGLLASWHIGGVVRVTARKRP